MKLTTTLLLSALLVVVLFLLWITGTPSPTPIADAESRGVLSCRPKPGRGCRHGCFTTTSCAASGVGITAICSGKGYRQRASDP